MFDPKTPEQLFTPMIVTQYDAPGGIQAASFVVAVGGQYFAALVPGYGSRVAYVTRLTPVDDLVVGKVVAEHLLAELVHTVTQS